MREGDVGCATRERGSRKLRRVSAPRLEPEAVLFSFDMTLILFELDGDAEVAMDDSGLAFRSAGEASCTTRPRSFR